MDRSFAVGLTERDKKGQSLVGAKRDMDLGLRSRDKQTGSDFDKPVLKNRFLVGMFRILSH